MSHEERNASTVRELLHTLGGGVAAHDDVLTFFAPDASYRMNAWRDPVVGRPAIRAELARQATMFADLSSEVVHLVAAGDLVMVERLDSMTIGGRPVTLHFAGRFTLDDDGLVVDWRDWFDSAEVAALLGNA